MAPPIRSQFLALVALTGLVLLVEHLIVTDAEAIEALAGRAARAAGERDLGTLAGLLSEDFTYGSRDHAETVQHVDELLRRHKPTGIEIHLHEIRVEDGRATATGVVAAQAYGRPFRVRIDVALVETEDGWRLAQIRGAERYAR